MSYQFVSKQKLSYDEIQQIKELEKIVMQKDMVHLKLELEYKHMYYLKDDKLFAKVEDDKPSIHIEYLCFEDGYLIGYLGVCEFGGDYAEINGMVHPAYRRNKIFTTLFQQAVEHRKNLNQDILLLCDSSSSEGMAFITSRTQEHHHNEYEMLLAEELYTSRLLTDKSVILREATNKDSYEVFEQNKIYFNSNKDEDEISLDVINPEEEKEKGFYIYLAIDDKKVVGKVNIQYNDQISGIYGLGVKPEYRSMGYGRAILTKAIELIRLKNNAIIILQVEAMNMNALKLYESCGFKTAYTMSYYKLRIKDWS